MDYEKVQKDFSSFNEPIYILGESDNYEFYHTQSRVIVRFKNKDNPFPSKGEYSNEIKGKILDELSNAIKLVEDINNTSLSCSFPRRETLEQTDEYAVFVDVKFYGEVLSEILDNNQEVKSVSLISISLLDVLEDIKKTNEIANNN